MKKINDKSFVSTSLGRNEKLFSFRSSFAEIKNSFKFAFSGLKETLIFERNFQIMFVAALAMTSAMFYFKTSRTEKAIIFTAIFAILTLELVNTAIERLLNFLEPKHHEQVRLIKDLMAAVVLVACFGAIIIGLIVFWPYFRISLSGKM